MTKKAFKYDMQRGLGSCVLELQNTQDIEKYRPLVLWGCSRDMAYDAQCEGCRSVYLYQLITQFPDYMPFIDILGKRLFQSMCSRGWEFLQDCEILSYFALDGEKQAWDILRKCYGELFQILLRKRKRTKDGRLPERDNFESLCLTLVTMRPRMYQMLVSDIGVLTESNSLYSALDFMWFQDVSESKRGKKAVHRILHHPNADEGVKAYVRSMEEGRERWERARVERKQSEPKTADEIYERLKGGEGSLSRWLMNRCGWQEVAKLAEYYKGEKESGLRYRLLSLLANESCAWALEPALLIADSRSDHSELAGMAFQALGYVKDEKVREYAYELLQSGVHRAKAVSMLAANYEDRDKDVLIHAAKQIPITYKDGEWHGAFIDIMKLFSGPAKRKPRELLLYMYQNTLCSFCREHVVREMGRRRMLTRELLEAMQYDCNREIRAYAERKLRRL